MEVLLRGLQVMAVEESMPGCHLGYGWNLVERVFKWLLDYTKDPSELSGMLPAERHLHVAEGSPCHTHQWLNRSRGNKGIAKIVKVIRTSVMVAGNMHAERHMRG